MFRTRSRTAGIFAAGALVVALGACAEDDQGPPADPDQDQAGSTDDAEDTEDTDGTDAGEQSDGSDPADLPGEVVEVYPYEGDSLDVIGVEAEDVLYVRNAPDPEADPVTELEPLAEEINATGNNRALEEGAIWAEVEADGVTGWANTTFLGYLGETSDAGEDFGDLEPADSPEQLATLVGERAVQETGADGYVIAAGPGDDTAPEFVIDLIGLADDSIGGERLALLGGTDPSGDYAVESVERTVICDRGVNDEGLCL